MINFLETDKRFENTKATPLKRTMSLRYKNPICLSQEQIFNLREN